MEYKDIIAAFAAQSGLQELVPDDEGTVSLIADNHQLNIFYDAQREAVTFNAIIGNLPDGRPEKADLDEAFLRCNFMYLETAGSIVTRHPEHGDYELFRTVSAIGLDTERFIGYLDEFLGTLEKMTGIFKECLSDMEQATADADHLQLMNGAHLA
ncbi:MAG: type III secretion system chaperone [Succinivibrio sp.]|nr:type III secretion system chaperone [Succinivibrio sp.]